jgi:hypothetical protein
MKTQISNLVCKTHFWNTLHHKHLFKVNRYRSTFTLSCHNELYFLNNTSVIFLTQLYSISEYCRINFKHPSFIFRLHFVSPIGREKTCHIYNLHQICSKRKVFDSKKTIEPTQERHNRLRLPSAGFR